MNKNENTENDSTNIEASTEARAANLLTDSLLKNYAATPDGTDDEEFLDRVETAMDAESGGHAEFATAEVTEIPQPSARKGWGRRLAWSTGIAALLAVGFGALAWRLNFIPAVDRNPPQLLAMAADVREDVALESQPVVRHEKQPSAVAPATTPTGAKLAKVAAEVKTLESQQVILLQQPPTTATAPTDATLAKVSEANFRSVEPPMAKDTSEGKTQASQDHIRGGRAISVSSGGSTSYFGSKVPSDAAAPPMSTTTRGSTGFRAVSGNQIGRTSSPHFVENSTARYGELIDNHWKSPNREPLSTFSIDVDTASWTNIRSMLERGVPIEQIPKDAVRIEEMINYFDWKYPRPDDEHPFGFAVESASCPWQADHRLLRIAIQGKSVKRSKRPSANLVFLLDVSGSMNQPDKLPLLQQAISVLVEELNANDCVSMVVYAGAEGVALHPTKGNQQAEILDALNRLRAGGSTNGGAGIDLAYKMAAQNFIKDGINRVILCTDGDFNVGRTGTESLVQFVERKAKRDRTFLSVCGFGDDNLNDAMLEAITNKGNGTYYYIDSFAEARKVFLKDLMGTLVTIAKDVKIQVEFNPGEVKAYRLIGYSNRRLAAEDFANDKVDAGEIGAGHTVTAFYEIVPAGNPDDPSLDVTSTLRYQRPAAPEPPPEPKLKVVPSHELALLKLRYKKPDGDKSIFLSQPVMPNERDWRQASDDFRFASAVALFGLKLRDHESARDTELADIIAITKNATGNDPHGYRAEFVKLLKQLGH